MSNCTKIIELIRQNDDEGLEEGMNLLFHIEELKKIIHYHYNKYRGVMERKGFEWEDLYYEVILRFVSQVQEGKGPKSNCMGFLYKMCRNMCNEFNRELEREQKALKDWYEIIIVPENKLIWERANQILKMLGGQCEQLLRLKFFSQNPITDSIDLANILQARGYHLKPSVIPATISRCKRKLRDLLKGDSSGFFEQ